MPEDSEIYLRTRCDSIETGFFMLIAGLLSLSIQFAPKMGNQYKWVLIASWGLSFLALMISGYRIISKYHVDTFTPFRERMCALHKNILNKIEGQVERIEKLPKEMMNEHLLKVKELVKPLNDSLKKLQDILATPDKMSKSINIGGKLWILQITFFLIAIFFNLVFAVLNYLKTKSSP